MPPAQHDPEPIAGALICDPEGCLFLMQSHKWGDRYIVPGGRLQFQHQQCDDDGQHAVAERFQPAGPGNPWSGLAFMWYLHGYRFSLADKGSKLIPPGPQDQPFACGSALAIRKETFLPPVGHAVQLGHRLAALIRDGDAIEGGAAAFAHLHRLGQQGGVGPGRAQEVDVHAQRHRDLTVRVAGGGESEVGQGEDGAAVRHAQPVQQLRPQAQAGTAEPGPDLQQLDAQQPGEPVPLLHEAGDRGGGVLWHA